MSGPPLSEAQIAAVTTAVNAANEEGEGSFAVASVAPLSAGRRAIYAAAGIDGFPAAGTDPDKAVAAVCCVDGGDTIEHIVVVVGGGDGGGGAVTADPPITYEDKIMFDDVPLSGIVEYRFGPAGPRLLGTISTESLSFYVKSKFKVWRELLQSGGNGCKRSFRSLLRTGLITRIYDPIAFPSPPAELPDWQVMDENTGKRVDIPRPVADVRVWDAGVGGYRALQGRLEGAPAVAEEAAFWAETLKELKELYGADLVDELMEAVLTGKVSLAETGASEAGADGAGGLASETLATEPLTASVLASASLLERKNLIGKRLVPLIQNSHDEALAGNITGMLLELDNSKLLHLLEDPTALALKVEEAVQVLDDHARTASQAPAV